MVDKEEILNHSISVLNRTKRSLSASVSPDSQGQLLDKALAKQIAVRQAELDSLLLPRSVSVIVRSSTPDPEATCEESCLDNSVFPIANPTLPHIAPQDSSVPLSNFLDSIEEGPPLPPRHPVVLQPGGVGGGTPVISRAPSVPWSPPRREDFRFTNQTSKSGSLLDILTESAPLLHPLFDTLHNQNPEDSDEMNAAQAKAECESKERKFNRLVSTFAPADYNASVVLDNKKDWTEKMWTALDDLIDSVECMNIQHGHVLGDAEVDNWKRKVTRSQTTFKEVVN